MALRVRTAQTETRKGFGWTGPQLMIHEVLNLRQIHLRRAQHCAELYQHTGLWKLLTNVDRFSNSTTKTITCLLQLELVRVAQRVVHAYGLEPLHQSRQLVLHLRVAVQLALVGVVYKGGRIIYKGGRSIYKGGRIIYKGGRRD